MHGIQCDDVEFHNCTSLVKYKYILVHTGIYWYVLVHTSKTQQTSFDHAPSSLLRLRVSAEHLAWSFLTVFFRTVVSSTVRPPRCGFPRPKFHSQMLTSYTLQPHLPSAAAESALPMENSEPLCLLNLCGTAHTTNSQKQNNIVNMSEIHQYIAVHASMYQYILVYTSTYYYILVHTCTYQYVLVCTSTILLKYVQVYRGIYQYILVCTCVHHVLVHTRTYQYVLCWRSRYW